jgi:hypothetical protein
MQQKPFYSRSTSARLGVAARGVGKVLCSRVSTKKGPPTKESLAEIDFDDGLRSAFYVSLRG